jgi:uncharacterized protein (DUF2249 family)
MIFRAKTVEAANERDKEKLVQAAKLKHEASMYARTVAQQMAKRFEEQFGVSRVEWGAIPSAYLGEYLPVVFVPDTDDQMVIQDSAVSPCRTHADAIAQYSPPYRWRVVRIENKLGKIDYGSEMVTLADFYDTFFAN